MLLEKIQAASLEARKSKDAEKAATLVTLYAEAARIGKDAGNRLTTDEETIRVVRKFLKGVDETLPLLTQPEAIERAKREKSVLEAFLPTMVAGAELQAVIADIVSTLAEKSPKQMGAVMGALKKRLAGSYDGNEASALVKAALA
jgi:uncharacterized protein